MKLFQSKYLKSFIAILSVTIFHIVSFGQTYNMTNGNVTTCSGTFYDSGGASGNYGNNENFVYTICPDTPGNAVRLDFVLGSFQTEFDYDQLKIYDGNSTAAPLMGMVQGAMNPFPFIATNATGCLTIEFTSNDNTTDDGWEANISCSPLDNSPQVIMGDGTASACDGYFYDSGGPGNGTNSFYQNGEDYTLTICPDTPGALLTMDFTFFKINSAYGSTDNLKVYDGTSTSDPLIDTYTYDNSGNTPSNIPGLITATNPSGCLTFVFHSDNVGYSLLGWEATIGCIMPPCAVTVAPNTAADCDNPSTSIITDYDNTLSYSFSPSGPTIDGSGVITGTPGDYTVTVTDGACTNDATFTIDEELDEPPVDAGPDKTICQGDCVNLEGDVGNSGSGGSGTLFEAHNQTDLESFTFENPSTGSPNGFYVSDAYGDAQGTDDYEIVFTGPTGSPSFSSDATATSPLIDPLCHEDLQLSFKIFSNNDGQNNDITLTAEVSLNGMNWDVLYTENATGTTIGPLSISENLGAAFNNQSFYVRFKIHINTTSWMSHGHAWFIDNIEVTGTPCDNLDYEWSGGTIDGVNDDLAPEVCPDETTTYVLTVNDNGCIGTDTVTVFVDSIQTLTDASDQTICEDESLTDITLDFGGGATGVDVTGLPSGVTSSVSGNTVTISGTPPATGGPFNYTVETKPSSSECPTVQKAGTITVNEKKEPTFSFATEFCVGATVPSLPLTSDSPDNINGSWTPSNIDNQNSSDYIFTPDNGECASEKTVHVTINGPAIGTDVQATCGSYTWIDGNTYTTSNNTASFTIPNGSVSGCDSIVTLDLTIHPPGATIDNITTTENSCNGPDGTITVTASGGTGSLNYELDNGQTSSIGNFTGLTEGTYEVTVSDNNGCETTQTVTVTKANTPTLTIDNVIDISCFGANDGSAEVSASGGKAPYTFNWTPSGENGGTVNNLTPGSHEVTVTDDNGCSTNAQITINQPDKLEIIPSITAASCGIKDGSISLDVTGGNGNYNYDWTPNVSSDNQVDSVNTGDYQVIVSDQEGCRDTFSINVPEDPLYIEAHPNSTTINQGDDKNIYITVDPNRVIDEIIWSPSKGLSCTDCKDPIATPESSTVYTVTVTDSLGCTAIDTVHINVNKPCGEVFVPNTFSPNGDGLNDFECVYGDCIVSLNFTIFNRWGENVFQSTDIDECWDGRYKGKFVQSGVYVYKLVYTLKSNEKKEKTGNITVVR